MCGSDSCVLSSCGASSDDTRRRSCITIKGRVDAALDVDSVGLVRLISVIAGAYSFEITRACFLAGWEIIWYFGQCDVPCCGPLGTPQ
jgi:hypothetical protein